MEDACNGNKDEGTGKYWSVRDNNKRLLRQKTGGACLYMPQDGHWLATVLKLYPPKVSFSAAKKKKIPRIENGMRTPTTYFILRLVYTVECQKLEPGVLNWFGTTRQPI